MTEFASVGTPGPLFAVRPGKLVTKRHSRQRAVGEVRSLHTTPLRRAVRMKTDMPHEDLFRCLNQTQQEIQHFRAALFEAESILSDLDDEYQRDDGCDQVKINRLIERGARFVSIRRAR